MNDLHLDHKNQILITGASGFIGSYYLKHSKWTKQLLPVSLRKVAISEINWNEATRPISAILHLAGKAHQMEPIPDQIYFDINRDLTLDLAKTAKANGVSHFIFVSTVKVFGESRVDGILSADSPCHPEDPYGQSKYEAEILLKELEDEHFKVAIVRPPLVYGPAAKGNIERLNKLIDLGIPLPLGGIQNRRSMVSLERLTEIFDTLLENELSGTFLATNGPPISTSDFIRQLAKERGKTVSLFPVPGLGLLLKLVKPALWKRLFGSFELAATPIGGKGKGEGRRD